MVRTDEEVELLKLACDTVAEHGVRIAHQTHFFTLFETVDESLEIVKRVDRPNFGITFGGSVPRGICEKTRQRAPNFVARYRPAPPAMPAFRNRRLVDIQCSSCSPSGALLICISDSKSRLIE